MFDMSVPDALGYINKGCPVFTRASELEPTPSFYEEAEGVWVDAFRGIWYSEEVLSGFLDDGKRVCVVSAELHQRAHLETWKALARMNCRNHPRLSLCTDLPEDASAFFEDA